MNRRIRLAALLFVCALNALGGGVSYPVLGHVHMEEGTVEVWFSPMTKLHRDVGNRPYTHIFRLFGLRVPGEFSMNCSWYARPTRRGLKMSMGSFRLREGMAGLLGSPLDHWKTGEAHHVAFTWRGKRMGLWADGVRIAARGQMIGLTGQPGKARIIFGDHERDSPIVVHAVRVSAIARPQEQLQAAKPVADTATTLLDIFDDSPKDDVTRAAVVAGLFGESGGRLIRGAHFTTTPKPGLAMHRERQP